ncbi:MAG: DUF1987 domain-containing protein [Bacteroidales bacterium]|nr:DUF1987 domain-containing protein [Bacteroidales bacterium]
MDAIKIEGTSQTPKVIFDKENNQIEISGHSLPENVQIFYSPLLEWVDKYLESPNDKTQVVFKMDYYNTASSKMIFEILKKFDKLHGQGKDVEIHWYYSEDDEDMEEAGEDYSSIVDVPFKLISYSV